jgi:hypothetical protein
VVPKWPRTTFAQNKKFCTQNVFLGLCDATSPYKNLVKIGKTKFFPHAIQKPNFPTASAVIQGGGDGRGFGGVIFLAVQGQPSHINKAEP